MIEVLVVVAIIALLIAVLLPSLSRARAQGRNAQCRSNLHQLGIGSLEYAAQNKGVVRGEAGNSETDWSWLVARELHVKVQKKDEVPVDRLEFFHCPEREIGQPTPFLDFVVNGLNPEGPSDTGVWPKHKWVRVDEYRRGSDVVYLNDAEREDRVVAVAPSPAGPTVLQARLNWVNGLFNGSTIDVMDVRTGSHLPEGKDGINVSDDPGVRRAARKLHLGRYTNAEFLDGHASGLALAGRATDQDNYGVWLSRFGVKNFDLVKLLPIQ